MICQRCGTDNRTGRRFCRDCGTALVAGCPNCGTVAEPGDRFCGTCGGPLGEAAGTSPSGVERAAGRAPLPGGENGPTERRIVSVLFADLVGFTALSDDRDPESVREFLDGYFALARERIGRYGGTIEKFIGDAVMAVWGTPVAHEDDAERAVRAALDLLDAVASLRTPDGAPIAIRAAVLTGEAAVAIAADGQAMVAGDLVNTASRLQSVAPPGTVLVGEATVRASESAIVYEPVGEQLLRGKQLPVAAWRAARIVAGRGGFGRSTRLEAPFVGRDDELRLLKELLHATAREKRARLVSVLGIAGIGKSRLAWELEKYIDGLVELVYWHQGRSPAYGDGLAFWALGEMVRGRARIVESDPPEVARGKLAEMAAEYLPDPDERARVEPRLAALLGLGGAAGGSTEELTAAWRTLFERISDRGPTVLVFEDLHWADPGLLDFIEGLLASARNRPILVLALARPELIEDRPTFGSAVRNHTRLDLAPLTDEAMELLLLGLVPGIPQDALRTIRDRAAGIPLYAVETVRMLLDQGRLSEADGRFRLAGDLGALAVPESLQALLGARLDTLDDAAREVMGLASVLGVTFTVESLVALADRPAEEVERTLEGLVARELLDVDVDPLSPERGRFRFIQGVLREVAYARLSRRERLARHLAAARYFGTVAGDELAGVVASHSLAALRSAPDDAPQAELATQAMTALEAAAARARTIGAHASAAGYLADAVELATDPASKSRLNEARADALFDGGRYSEAEEVARGLVGVAQTSSDLGLEARGALILVRAIMSNGRPAEARAEAEATRERLGAFADEELDGISLTAEIVRARLMSGDPAAARDLVEIVLPIAERLGLRSVVGELMPSRAWAIAAERPFEAVALLRGSLVFNEREGLFNAEMRSRMNLSSFDSQEAPAEALEVALTGARRARERGFTQWAKSAAGNACSAARLLGDWDQVEALAAELDVLAEWTGPWDFTVPGELIFVRSLRGRLAEAQEIQDRYDTQFADNDDPQVRLSSMSTREALAVSVGDLGTAIGLGRMIDRAVDELGVNGEYDLGLAAAVEARDGDRIAEIATILHGLESLRVTHALSLAASGAQRALAGDAGGLLEMDRAVAEMRVIGVGFCEALVQRSRYLLAPDDPGAPAAAAEAIRILTDLGAVTLLRGLPTAPTASTTPPEPTDRSITPAAT